MGAYRFSIWTGPAIVEQVASNLRSHGLEVYAGTERVYFYGEGDSRASALDNAGRDIRRIYPHAGFKVSLV